MTWPVSVPGMENLDIVYAPNLQLIPAVSLQRGSPQQQAISMHLLHHTGTMPNICDLRCPCTDMEGSTWLERGSRDTHGTATTHVGSTGINMGGYSLRDNSTDSYSTPSNY